MAGSALRVLLFFGIPLAFAKPNNVMVEGVPMSIESPQPRQDVPVEDFSGGFSNDFALDLPTNEFLGNFYDRPAAQKESMGFIIGKPNNFPSFFKLGGFKPMSAEEKGDEGASFVPPFEVPQMEEIGEIDDHQPEFELPDFAQQKQDSTTLRRNDISKHETRTVKKLERTRRRAGEPDAALDPSTIPHKRVHRVQTEGQVPHSRIPREFQDAHDNQAAFSDVPYHVQPFPEFQFPVFQSERIPSSADPSGRYNSSPRPRGRINRKVEIRTPDDDFIVPESQRFYPNFNPRLPPTPPIPSNQPFFPSSPPALRKLGPRGGRFNGHGPGFRESPSIRSNNDGFRDFHDTFYGPGAGEAINRPDFVFPSSRRPHHRENEPLDNTLLGSGNFEILRGGTFYDEDDPDIHNGYDHLLHYGSHSPHNGPHSNNHVDDFFSNFRDFSEFAARRSDEGETSHDDSSYYGYASEHIQHVIDSSHPDFKDALSSNRTQEVSSVQHAEKTEEKKTKTASAQSINSKVKLLKTTSKQKQPKKHRQPKNIQEVLEDLEATPSDNSLSPLTDDDKDPMLALF